MLAKKFGSQNPSGYLISEKLDGYRAVWDGSKFLSKEGNVIYAPAFFTEALPKTPLDGEIWAGRSSFEQVASAIKGSLEANWKRVIYVAFDVPIKKVPLEERLAMIPENLGRFASKLQHEVCEGKKQLDEMLKSVISIGGEGVMLRRPGSFYFSGRTDALLKYKAWHDAEGVVISYLEGTRKGMVGAIIVQTKDGQVKVGTLPEKVRANPPKIGTVITYRYSIKSAKGKPKSAFYVREHLA